MTLGGSFMQANRTKGVMAIALLMGLSGCSFGDATKFDSSSNSANCVGAGCNMPGSGSITVPTANAVVARITNGLQGNVSVTTGNFAKSFAEVKGNLPKVTDPTKATGFDAIQLLVYAACSDLTTGTTPKMQSFYNVNPTQPMSSQQSAIVAAGTKMLDAYVAGLASKGPNASQVNTALNNLFTNTTNGLNSDSSNTTTMAFMSACIAANTAGTALMSF